MTDKAFTQRLPEELHSGMAAAADAERISLNTAIIHACRLWLAQHPTAESHPEQGSTPSVRWVRDRDRFDDGDDPDTPMPEYAIETGRALGRISFVLRNLLGNAKLPATLAESCTEAVDLVTSVAQYLSVDAAKPPTEEALNQHRQQSRRV